MVKRSFSRYSMQTARSVPHFQRFCFYLFLRYLPALLLVGCGATATPNSAETPSPHPAPSPQAMGELASPVAGPDAASQENSLGVPTKPPKYIPEARLSLNPPVVNEAECEILIPGRDADGFKTVNILTLDDPKYPEYVPLLIRALQETVRDSQQTEDLQPRIAYLTDCLQRLPP